MLLSFALDSLNKREENIISNLCYYWWSRKNTAYSRKPDVRHLICLCIFKFTSILQLNEAKISPLKQTDWFYPLFSINTNDLLKEDPWFTDLLGDSCRKNR